MAAGVAAKTFHTMMARGVIRAQSVATRSRFWPRFLSIAGGMLSLGLMTGCQSNKSAAGKSGLPYDRVWAKAGTAHENYTAVIVRPVNTEYLLGHGGWTAANPAHRELGLSAQDLADYTRETFMNT